LYEPVFRDLLSNYTPDAAGFAKIQDDLKSKFGDNAYYSNINIIYTAGNRPGSGITLNPGKGSASLTDFHISMKPEAQTLVSTMIWMET
jgi:hypothetical protein